MAAPRVPRTNLKKKQDESTCIPPTRISAITLVPNEQFIVFAGFESGLIHRLRRNFTGNINNNNNAEEDAETPAVVLVGHTAPITGLSAPATGDEVTSCSLDGTIKIWQSTITAPENNKRCIKTINVGQPVRSFLAVADTYYCGTTSGSIVRVENNKVVDELIGGHSDSVTAIAMAESGALLSASLDGTTIGWDLGSRQPVYVFKGHGGAHVRAAATFGTNLLSCGSDESVCCFNIPLDFTAPVTEEYSSGAGDNNNAYGEENENVNENVNEQEENNNNAENQGENQEQEQETAEAEEGEAGANKLIKINWVIKPSARVFLPWLPTSIVICGNYAVIGTSARIVASINIRNLLNKITEYGNRVETSISAATRKLRKLAFEKKKKVNRLSRKAIRDFKAAHSNGGGEGEEGTGGGEEEEDQYNEDGEYIGGGGNQGGGEDNNNSAEIEEFERTKMEEAQSKSVDIDSDVAGQIAKFGRLRNQFFVQPATNFITSAMCDILPGICSDAVLGVAGEGVKIYAGSGFGVVPLQLRPRVRAV